MKQEIYAVIQCGYEGIEKLLFASPDPKEAASKVIELKEEVHKAQEEASKYNESQWSEMYSNGKISDEVWEKGKHIDPDQYCVHMWNGKKFDCCCQELEVPPDKQWLM